MFDPRNHGFWKLPISGPGELQWFERQVYGVDLDRCDTLRVNVYLTRDGRFTTIWYGLLDPSAAECKLDVTSDLGLNLSELYEKTLFRGDIQDGAFGAKLLDAIRVPQNVACQLSMSDEFGLECRPIK